MSPQYLSYKTRSSATESIQCSLLKWWVKELTPVFKKVERTIPKNFNYFPLPAENILWWYVAFKDKKL